MVKFTEIEIGQRFKTPTTRAYEGVGWETFTKINAEMARLDATTTPIFVKTQEIWEIGELVRFWNPENDYAPNVVVLQI
jgi:hypothetical protein